MLNPVKWTLQCSLCGTAVNLRSLPKFKLDEERYPDLNNGMEKLFGRSILVKKYGIAYWVELMGGHICSDCAKTLDVAFGEIKTRRESHDVDGKV